MGVYVITDGDGNYIRKDDSTGKYVPIRSFRHAHRWEDEIKANCVLSNSISKHLRDRYSVQQINTSGAVNKEFVSKNKVYLENIIEDNVQEWLDKINIVIDIFSDIDNKDSELNEKISEIDKKIVDVNHYIEFGKFNASQGFLCNKLLQNLFRQRRKYKNEKQILSLLKQIELGKDSVDLLSQVVENIKNKKYMPRAIPELFQ